MIAQPYHLYIERNVPEKNMARYYALSIQPTLFGQTSLVRAWGRIGLTGQRKTHVFDKEAQAVELFLEITVGKRKRGYKPRSSCGNPSNWS